MQVAVVKAFDTLYGDNLDSQKRGGHPFAESVTNRRAVDDRARQLQRRAEVLETYRVLGARPSVWYLLAVVKRIQVAVGPVATTRTCCTGHF